MDLSLYYNEFQSSYTLAICAVILYLFAVAFVGVRLWKSKKETKRSDGYYEVKCIVDRTFDGKPIYKSFYSTKSFPAKMVSG